MKIFNIASLLIGAVILNLSAIACGGNYQESAPCLIGEGGANAQETPSKEIVIDQQCAPRYFQPGNNGCILNTSTPEKDPNCWLWTAEISIPDRKVNELVQVKGLLSVLPPSNGYNFVPPGFSWWATYVVLKDNNVAVVCPYAKQTVRFIIPSSLINL